MADFAGMSHPERVLYLAGLEVDCLHPKPLPWLGGHCPDCGGKRKTPRFPMMRRRPTAQELRSLPHAGEARELWVPVISLEAVVAAADTFPDWTVGRWGPGQPVMAAVDGYPAEGVSPGEALSLALCKAVEGEK